MPFDKVILHPKTNEELKRLQLKKNQGDTANLLAEWGIKGSLQRRQNQLNEEKAVFVIMLLRPPSQERPLSLNAKGRIH